MKKMVLIVSLLVTSTFAQGSDDLCSTISEFAGAIMKARQAGVPASRLVRIAEENDEGSDSLTVEMIERAFEAPRYSTQEFQQQETEEFSSMYYLECYKAKR